ncbi:MAG: transposase [Planctomycetes bacterium]|nr:transposase [Planctomycetota bacterium]
MGSKRRRHSAQFKAKVALEAIKGVKSLSQLAAQYEVHPTQIAKWKKHLLDQLPGLFSDRRRGSDLADEQLKARLYQQIGQLQVELDWLKKKCGLES